ncbi:RNA-guided endonuclease TnpB family protein [Nocardia rhamnosiphila]|uniref:RNA-guided endonuclease TnpB family protein n=1 Tax=Nocardia rhamnosiphila TaxID=426716 RepID=A0ABV2WK93_9NOCA
MSRHTAFRYCLDPTVEQQTVLARHAGAARFAYNQCLAMVKTALTQRRTDPEHPVPWTRFDLINAFNTWKKSAAAGRIFTVDPTGVTTIEVTGLAWRNQVCQQVFEEAATDCGRGLTGWSDSRSGKRRGRRVGFPRFKKKTTSTATFRLRNKHAKNGRPTIRIGEGDIPRSVTLPGLGQLRVREDTRRLRRMLTTGRAKILSATVSQRAGRWWISVSIEAADLHPGHHHPVRVLDDGGGWVGIDRGLSAFLVAATIEGREVARVDDPPKPLARGLARQRRLTKVLSRKEKGSRNRREAAARLARHHHRVANVRRHFLHQVTNELVKTHDRLVVEDLHVAGMLRNRRLARAIADAGWADFGRLLYYKQRWRGGTVVTADRWFPSSKRCSACGTLNPALKLTDRVFGCGCGYRADRDLNAAVNLAAWPTLQNKTHHDPRTSEQGAGLPMPADGKALTGTRWSAGATGPGDAGTEAPIPAGV